MRPRKVSRRWLFGGLALLVGLAAVGVWQRAAVWSAYCIYHLDRSTAADRAVWVGRVADLGLDIAPRLLARLGHPGRAAAAADALAALTERCPQGDARLAPLASELAQAFPRLPTPGQQAALEVGLRLADRGDPTAVAYCRELAHLGVRHQAADLRLTAVRLAMRPDIALLEPLVPLLDDPEPTVRQAALLAVGPARAVVSDEDLLRHLHDPDAEARQLCETALRSRGLSEKQVRMGRLFAAPDFLERLRVLDYLEPDDPDLDPTAWLNRLSHDAVPAVRAGVARAGEALGADFAERLGQMAGQDPDPTVRRIAAFHLRQMRSPPERLPSE